MTTERGDAQSDAPIVVHGEIHGAGAPYEVETPGAPVDRHSEPPASPPALAHPPTTGGESADRIASLDALRGLFVVAITVTFALYGDWYPTWMYHRQFPPPWKFVDIPGITWLDIPYAGFLFTAAAAIPIALSRRVERGMTEISVALAAARRFVLLAVFALLIGHSNTYFTGYTQNARIAAVIGFAIMFALFVRRRPDWNERAYSAMNTMAWIAAIAFLAFGPMIYDSTFSVEKRDEVIMDIAFAALVGSILWYFTRDNLGARLAALAAAVALHLGAKQTGWIGGWWWDSPAPWLLMPAKLVLLAIVVPGTIAGDLLLRWTRSATSGVRRWGAGRALLVAFIAVAFTPLVIAGLYTRMTPITAQIAIALIVAGIVLTWDAGTERERLLRRLFIWGAFWLLIGLFLEPVEGVTKKVPETLSYFFVMAGVSTMLLLAFIVFVDAWGWDVWAKPFVEVGRNPMFAYVLYSILINSLLELVPAFRTVLRVTPAQALLRTFLSTLLVIVIVQAFTRRRVIWRT